MNTTSSTSSSSSSSSSSTTSSSSSSSSSPPTSPSAQQQTAPKPPESEYSSELGAEEIALLQAHPSAVIPLPPPRPLTVTAPRGRTRTIVSDAYAARPTPAWYGVRERIGFDPDPSHGVAAAKLEPLLDDAARNRCPVHVSDLPPEILMRVFQHLDMSSLANAMAVCRTWRYWAGQDTLWQGHVTWFLGNSNPINGAPHLHRIYRSLSLDIGTHEELGIAADGSPRLPWYQVMHRAFVRATAIDASRHYSMAAAYRARLGGATHRYLRNPRSSNKDMINTFLQAFTMWLLTLLSLALVTLFCLKIDGVLTTSWLVVWTPFPLLAIGIAGILVVNHRIQPRHRRYRSLRTKLIMYTVPATLVLGYLAMLGIRLDGSVHWNWAALLTPVYLATAFVFASSVAFVLNETPRMMRARGRRNTLGKLSWPYVLAGCIVLNTVCLILQVLFVPLRLTDTVGWPWTSVLVPAMILVGVTCVGTLAYPSTELCSQNLPAVLLLEAPVLAMLIAAAILADSKGAYSAWAAMSPLAVPIITGILMSFGLSLEARDEWVRARFRPPEPPSMIKVLSKKITPRTIIMANQRS